MLSQMTQRINKKTSVFSFSVVVFGFCFGSFFSSLAFAQEESNPKHCLIFASSSAWNCSAAFRGDFVRQRFNETLPAPEVPSRTFLVDFNMTGKSELLTNLRVHADVDLIARRSWDYKRLNFPNDSVITTQGDSSDNPAYRSSLYELYALFEPDPEYQLTVGKKRILWGSGLASNPTDLLNPSKSVLDPALERRGAWLAQFEHILEKDTFAVFFAPGVIEDKNTLPTDVFKYKTDSSDRRESHSLIGARWYHLAGHADLNLMAFYSDSFKDPQVGAWKAGASWSQSLLALSKQLEGHAEILLQQGSARNASDGSSRTKSKQFYTTLLLGSRYDFENESALIFEFLHQGEGDSRDDFIQRRTSEAGLLRSQMIAAARAGQSSSVTPVVFAQSSASGKSSQGEAGRTVSALGMQNYLLVNYQRYKFNDDLFLSWSLVHNLHDASGFQGPLLQWTPNQTLSLTLTANTDYALWPKTGMHVDGLGRIHEFELNPVTSRVGFEIKSFF
ncbi:hypothetical protein EBU99_12220 [bacterium]|nr:hypothetical protein [bacterium]